MSFLFPGSGGERDFSCEKTRDMLGDKILHAKLADTQWEIKGEPVEITLFLDPNKQPNRPDEVCLLVHMYGTQKHTFRTIPITIWYDWPGNIRIHYTDAASISFEGITPTVEGGVYDFYDNPPKNWEDVLDRIASHMSFLDACRQRLDRTLQWANQVSAALDRGDPGNVNNKISDIHNPNHSGPIIDV